MFARRLAVLVALLVAAPAAYADFTAEWQMTTDLADPLDVPQGAEIIVTITCVAQEYEALDPGDDITLIRVSWLDSSADLMDELQAGTWAWSGDLAGLGTFANDDDMADGIVYAQNSANGISPAAEYGVGTLTFNAPMEEGTYTIDIRHFDAQQFDESTGVGDGTAARIAEGYGLTLPGGVDFTVTPEPATLALVGIGLVATLIRRKK